MGSFAVIQILRFRSGILIAIGSHLCIWNMKMMQSGLSDLKQIILFAACTFLVSIVCSNLYVSEHN